MVWHTTSLSFEEGRGEAQQAHAALRVEKIFMNKDCTNNTSLYCVPHLLVEGWGLCRQGLLMPIIQPGGLRYYIAFAFFNNAYGSSGTGMPLFSFSTIKCRCVGDRFL